jgi:hypothetical protein
MPLDVHRKIQEGLATNRNIFTTEALHLVDQVALKEIVDPCPRLILSLIVFFQWQRLKPNLRLPILEIVFLSFALFHHTSLQIFRYIVQEELHEFVRILVLRCVEKFVCLPQSSKESSWREAPYGTLLAVDLGEKLREAHEERVPLIFLLLLIDVSYHSLTKWRTEVERLENTVRVASIRNIDQTEVLLSIIAQEHPITVTVLPRAIPNEAGSIGRGPTHAVEVDLN